MQAMLDAWMRMTGRIHVLLRRCGAELTITETIPKGAGRCRMVVRQG